MITYDPNAMLKKIAPEKKIKKLLTRGLNLKRAALSFVDDIDFLDKEGILRVALKTVKSYRKRLAEADSDQTNKSDLKDKLKKDPALLAQRVKNEIVTQISSEIRTKYRGARYEWLPSEADEPDPEHQLNYGKIFVVGQGEMPGERYGCQCGMNILVDDDELDL